MMTFGSPPRVWGKHGQRRLWRLHARFTPTRVGKTGVDDDDDDLSTVHPHACGENSWRTSGGERANGSPPRVWGKQRTPLADGLVLRFTPTRVGKTCSHLWRVAVVAVHPHACGENRGGLLCYGEKSGSPPRVWGKRNERTQELYNERFTPTRVGKTGAVSAARPPSPVHPHACGENRVVPAPGPQAHGSPPRVWGKPVGGAQGAVAQRFTPTRVGKTNPPENHSLRSSVHPHACGENNAKRLWKSIVAGSPPRVWGKQHHNAGPMLVERFTPTRVGKTGRLILTGSGRTVHPHACGENGLHGPSAPARAGSPPRVWGKR